MRTWKHYTIAGLTIVQTLIVQLHQLTGMLGEKNSETSDRYPVLIQPAGWAFSIWGPIYIAEILYVLAVLFYDPEKLLPSSNLFFYAFNAMNLLQVAWEVAFSQESITLSAVILVSTIPVLLAAFAAYLQHGAWRRKDCKSYISASISGLFLFCLGLHAGWVTVAGHLNINIAAVANKASLAEQIAYANMSIISVLIVIGIFCAWFRAPMPALSVSWAFLAIATNPKSQSGDVVDGYKRTAAAVAILVLSFAGAVFVGQALMKPAAKSAAKPSLNSAPENSLEADLLARSS
jgi:hypothetical protein